MTALRCITCGGPALDVDAAHGAGECWACYHDRERWAEAIDREARREAERRAGLFTVAEADRLLAALAELEAGR